MLTAQRGDLTKARAVLNRSFPIALLRAKQSPTAPGEIVVASFFTDLVTGRVSAAARTQKRILASLAKDRTNLPAHDIALSRIGVGMILSAEGQFSDAIIEFEAAIERYGSRDPYGQRPYLLAQYALALAASGDREGAQSVTFEANEGVHGTSRVTARFIDVQILLARMWCEQDVRTSAIETARKSREDELSLMELRALHILAMTDGATLDKSIVVRAKEIASSSSAPVASPLAAHIADLSRGVLRLVSESARVLARCGIHVPIRGMLTELTSRERDVAISASLGYSSKTIASRFGISKRTIDAHLNRIYLKLGIEGRYDLPEALDDANPQYRTDPELPSSTRATDRGAHDE